MKILVLSDSHGNTRGVLEAVTRHPDADAAFFLGEGSRDDDALEEEFPRLPVYRVCGNCDFGTFDPVEGLAPLGGVVFFYTHGQAYSVKDGLDRLAEAAKARGADVALFGHTHEPLCEMRDGVALFNPGSAGYLRGTYGVITVRDKRIHFAHEELQRAR